MWRRSESTLLALVFAASTMAWANETVQIRRAEIPDDYRSSSGVHKLFVNSADGAALSRLTQLGAIERTIDYGSFRLVFVNDDGLGALAEPALAGVALRDDLDLVGLNGWNLDTRVGEPRDLAASRRQQPALFDRQLYVVQFVGPMRDDWMNRLTRRGDTQVVGYLPNDAYVVFATPAAWARIATYTQHPRGPVQWAGVYHPAYRISPYLDAAIARGVGSVDVVVELVEHSGTDATQARIEGQALGTIADAVSLGGMRDLRLTLPAAAIERLAAEPDVFWIEPCLPKRKLDERQGQIMAGSLDATGTAPSAPGYLAFVNGKGFTSNFAFTVDVADDGFDKGSTTDVNVEFKDVAGNSRATYVFNYTTDALGDGGAGHGNCNCSIVGGFNDTQGNSAFEDAGGYQYGLGIAPYARIGMSKIFSNAGAFTSSSYSTLIASAYNAGARISSNSWGLNGAGANAYTTDSRQYDILVRDAASGTAGNQEMSIVFAAGNAGSAANTVGAPGTGKNVFTIGASENNRQTGTDGCGIANTGADNAKDVISFSSRGPCSDGRKKPDIMAPGTHIQGAASRSTVYDGTGVCNKFWPAGQTLYCWSSGTSHSTPAIAGASANVRQYFANQGWGTPSPAMTKAFLMSTTAYMTGVGANDTLPSNSQGLGRVDMGRAFDGTANVRVDESTVFANTGETFTTTGTIADTSKPFRVVLAWTDAPGTVSGNAWVNNLDLEVTVNGTLFRGNVFSGANSITGGVADTRNNTEAVFLAAGTSGSFSITVRATGISGDGVPGNGDTTDQDFALFVYNGSTAAPTPDFTISASPASQTVTQGNSTSYTTTVTSVNGFSSATSLSVSGVPAGSSASFSPASVTPAAGGSAASTLSVTTTTSTTPGTYTLTITGTSGALVHSTTVSLVVQAAPVPNFTISASPASQTVTQGNGTSYTATVTSVNGFSSATDLTVSGLPSGAGASFSPTPVTPPSGGSASSTLSVTTAGTTPAGTYTLTITGTSGTLVHSTTVSLAVQAVPVPDFTISASPASQTVTQGNGTSYTATVTSVNGFSAATNLSVTGLPSGATGNLSPSTVTPPSGGSATSTLSVTTAGTTPAGTYTLTITGTSGSLTHSTNVTLVVQAAGGGNQVVTFTSTPNLAIPDNNTTGVTNGIAVATAETITSVSVNVSITHTFQGDLEVSLIGPDATTVLLHNRTGGGTDNINTTYNVTTRSAGALTAFNGKNTSGTWTIKVRDLAAVDVGTLNSWKLTFNGYSTAAPNLAIPDNNTTGITSTINVAATGTIASLRVRVGITHTFQGDLEVSLIGPDNTTVILHNRTGAGTDNINTVYPDLTAPAQALTAFNGKAIAGAWKLKVRDLAAVDTGTLNTWEIDFRTQ
ncbi:MAG: proprotein convertase P-domain-containing protein [Planctomycetes bacterium]|nr:proprotein convertase P-domain-containing protein [Planctomycetota bacterium]MBI3843408.1 proprotein convertase P-domain-containing protein [Planctomycetota bacterium]